MSDFSKKVLEWKSKGTGSMMSARREMASLRRTIRQDKEHNRQKWRSDMRKIDIELDAIRVAMAMIQWKCDEITSPHKVDIPIIAVKPEDMIGLPEWNQPNIDERLNGKFLDKPESKIGHIPELKRCDCGAKHTAFPNHHSNWCSAKDWK